MNDVFLTVSETSEGLYKEKGSKFIGYLIPVNTIESVNQHLDSLRKEHPKSRHVCYSYRLGADAALYRINDDGEPSGTAGKPIYNRLLSAELTNILLAVVRYFGGTKLGASGLICAYKQCSADAIKNAMIVTNYVTKTYRVEFNISDMGILYNTLKSLDLDYFNEIFDQEASVDVNIRASKSEEMIAKLLAHFHCLSIDHIQSELYENRLVIEEI